MQFDPYLNFDGKCAEAFRYYEKVLGGKIEFMMTNGESPMAATMPADEHERVMHARLAVGDRHLLASDSPPGKYVAPTGLWISIPLDKPADARRIFEAFADNGTVHMAFEKTFWAAGGFGMCVDRYGTPWMINCEKGD
jgi:PhnB protein